MRSIQVYLMKIFSGGGGGGGGGGRGVYVCGGLIINLFFRGGSSNSNYSLKGSVNNIHMATGTSTVIHM